MRSIHRTCSFALAVALSNFAGAAAISQDSSAHTVAAAKILEAKGDVAGAVRVLQQALSKAPQVNRSALKTQLSLLVTGQAVGATAKASPTPVPAPQGQGQDPVDRLIQVLNTGDKTTEVNSATKQLRMLGNLVVPHLIRAFPDLGPFGVLNSLVVMRSTTDPRVGEFLAKQVKTAAPEIVTAIVSSLDEMPKAIALKVASEIVRGEPTESHELAALRVYLEQQPKAQVTSELKQKLLVSASSRIRALAAIYLIGARQLTEAEAVATVKTLSPAEVAQFDPDAPVWHRDSHDSSWAKFGVQCFPPAENRRDIGRYVEAFDWWRAAEDAAPLLLDARGAMKQVIWKLQEMVAHGWRLPAELDEAFWKFAEADPQYCWQSYMHSLPENGEDRAIRAWQQNELSRAHIIEGLHRTERPWTRLAVMDLLAADSLQNYPSYTFNYDWDTSSKGAIDGLVEFARKWPKVSPSVPESWARGLVDAYAAWPVLPIEVVQPLFASGYEPAWSAVTKRNPELLPSMARGIENLPRPMIAALVGQLRRYGTEADVPTAIRIMRMETHPNYYDMAAEFLGRMAKGNVVVLGLGAVDSKLEQQALRYVPSMVAAVAQGLNVRDLPAILALLPKLTHGAATAVCQVLIRQVDEAHVDALAAALQACYGLKWRDTRALDRHSASTETDAIGNRTLAMQLIFLLGKTKSEAALPHLRRVYEEDTLSTMMVQSAASAALKASGSSRRALLQQMLQSERQDVVGAVVQVEDLRSDAKLRELAFEGVLRFATQETESLFIFDVIEKDAQLALALKILNHEQMSSFQGSLVDRALVLLDGRKDDRYLPQLTRATKHSNSNTRVLVAQMLARTFVRESVDPLLDLLKDDSERVRTTAQESLDQIANYLDERVKWEKRFGKTK